LGVRQPLFRDAEVRIPPGRRVTQDGATATTRQKWDDHRRPGLEVACLLSQSFHQYHAFEIMYHSRTGAATVKRFGAKREHYIASAHYTEKALAMRASPRPRRPEAAGRLRRASPASARGQDRPSSRTGAARRSCCHRFPLSQKTHAITTGMVMPQFPIDNSAIRRMLAASLCLRKGGLLG